MLIYFMVIRQDTHGSRFLVQSGLSSVGAALRIQELTAGKPHKQTYEVIPYEPKVYAQVLKEQNIIV